MEDQITPREIREGLLKRILEGIGEFFSQPMYTMPGIEYLPPEAKNILYDFTSRGSM
jgi:hypothetical protein